MKKYFKRFNIMFVMALAIIGVVTINDGGCCWWLNKEKRG